MFGTCLALLSSKSLVVHPVGVRQVSISREMWFLRIFVVLFIVLQNHAGNSFDEFMHGEALYSSTNETSAVLFHGLSNTCSRTLRALDFYTRWKCKLHT